MNVGSRRFLPSREIKREIKREIVQRPVLQYPDFSKPFNFLTSDASGIAIGGIL